MAEISRAEQILLATLGRSEEVPDPQSRMEGLLIDLKEAIEAGGGGGGDAQLAARVAALESRMDTTEALDEVQNDLIDDKLDTAQIPAMTESEYEALETKTAKYYFLYEDSSEEETSEPEVSNMSAAEISSPMVFQSGLADPISLEESHTGLADPDPYDE